jgi:hypothetical protein
MAVIWVDQFNGMSYSRIKTFKVNGLYAHILNTGVMVLHFALRSINLADFIILLYM